MFRTLRARAGIFRLSRLPLTIQARIQRDGGGAVVQNVRFKRRVMRPRNLLGTTLGLLLLYNIFKQIVLAPLDKLAEELEESMDEETKKEISVTEKSNSSFFIPFPGTIKKAIQPKFRPSDPEWQEYEKFNKNFTLAQSVRVDLAGLARQEVTKLPWGKDAKLRRFWLEVDFPRRPPPVFLQSGIEITDDFISWTTKPIDSLAVKRISQAFYPLAAAKSTWSWLKILFTPGDPNTLSGRIISTANGLGPEHEGAYAKLMTTLITQQQRMEQMKTLAQAQAQARARGDALNVADQASNYNREKARQVQDSSGKQPDNIDEKSSNARNDASQKSAAPAKDVALTIRDTALYKMLLLRIMYANETSKYVFAAGLRDRKSDKDLDPRGGIRVFGLVELNTPVARFVVDVSGFWDPKLRVFDEHSLDIRLKKLQVNPPTPSKSS